MNAEPYVTFVSYFRNDNYTSDFVLRVKRATRFLVGQLERAALESEVVLVEWNPPPGRPLIVESLGPLPQGGNVRVRAIIVGKEHHQPFVGSQEWGMNPAAAANVGLRRAEGRFAHRGHPGVGTKFGEAAKGGGMNLDVPAAGTAADGAAGTLDRLPERGHHVLC